MVEKSGVVRLKLGVDKSGVEMSFNLEVMAALIMFSFVSYERSGAAGYYRTVVNQLLAWLYGGVSFFFLFFKRGDTSITARLQTKKFGQAPTLLFLTPRQALSSHLRVFVMIL